ncbi:LysR family transcriptional regulator [Azohydromonas lata]|uniref:LysR family transcriptional regulator n=1 Tax=Azohydromonas lata TaxID=45677 RepID=A0ABU5IEN8_9BURK|nr:LysR family transcriptional regulator [Azohydromonas lata]MDZ5457587.1 LysR family transcriptional regulator [Azohydromonas lata]
MSLPFQFSQLRCFVAVATELHFGRAAQRLNMTQPPLSRQVQQLEHALGVRLLERGPHAVRLTPAGQAFLGEAQRVLEAAQSAALAARRADTGEEGSIALGYVAGASFSVLPKLVAAASAQLPRVQIVLRDLSSSEQLEALRTGRLDAGIVRPPVALADFDSLSLLREPFAAALPAGHRLASRRRLRLQDLDGENLVMYEPGQGGRMYELLTSVFHTAGITPHCVQQVRQTYCMLGLVASGVGLALLQRSASQVSMAGVVMRPVELPAHAVSELCLVWRRKDVEEKPVMARFVEMVRGVAF